MSAVSIQSAKNRYNQFQALGNVTNIAVSAGYGVTYTQAGVAKSAKVPEIAANDQDYINTFENLIGSVSVSSTASVNPVSNVNQNADTAVVQLANVAASGSSTAAVTSTSNNTMMYILIAGIIVFIFHKQLGLW